MNFRFQWLGAILALCLASCASPTPQGQGPASGPVSGGPFRLGVDVLADNNWDLLRGKRVGLICNQTSMTAGGLTTRAAMKRGGVNLVALYSPEHGIDGTVKAGLKVSSTRDRQTGLPVYSLYGSTRKPTASMLAPIDVLVFDLQDIGSRSYTYISTMVLAMEACGENRKEFVVLDRPNPIGGWRVEGPPVAPQWKSFVSQINVPYVHGMTAGELAMMTAGEGWIRSRPVLRIVRMSGWNRGMLWRDTGLRWYRTSPNIPHAISPVYYVATGILGSAAAVDIGIGSDNPFATAGASGANAGAFTAYCQRLNFPGVRFTPYSKGEFAGARLSIDPRTPANLTALDVYMTAELNRQTRGRVLGKMTASQANLLNKVYGSDSLRRDLMKGVPPQRIVSSWSGFEQGFRARRQRYLSYP